MLPFGSITSVVPLVVLGFAYLVYLGAILLNKPAVSELSKPKESITIIEADAHENQISGIPDFRSLTDDEAGASLLSDDDNIGWEYFLSVIPELPPVRASVLHSVCPFLPRPPPAC